MNVVNRRDHETASPENDFISTFRFQFRRVHPCRADLNWVYYIKTNLDQVRNYGADRFTRVEEQPCVSPGVDKIEPLQYLCRFSC